MYNARLLESARILPFSCQERRGDDSPGWRQTRPTAVGWAGGWGCAVTGQLSEISCVQKKKFIKNHKVTFLFSKEAQSII